MRTLKIYLETTVFNFPFADDAPQYKADSLRLFDEIHAGKFEAFTSSYVIDELTKIKDTAKSAKMRALISNYNIKALETSDEIVRLAGVYVSKGVVPQKHDIDALHIAAATVYNADCIISLNFRHIVKYKTILETEFINAREGYKRIFIHTPAEIIEHD